VPTLMTPAECEDVVYKLARLKALGITLATGVPLSEDGTIGFMLSAIIGNR
jgi:hypothetical protein